MEKYFDILQGDYGQRLQLGGLRPLKNLVELEDGLGPRTLARVLCLQINMPLQRSYGERDGEDAGTAFCLYMASQRTRRNKAFCACFQIQILGCSCVLARKDTEKMGQDPAMSYELAVEKDASGWYNLLVEMQRRKSHCRMKRTLVQITTEAFNPSPTLGIKEQLALAPYSSEKHKSTIDWSKFQTPEPSSIVTTTPLPPSSNHLGIFPDGYVNPTFGTQEELSTFLKHLKIIKDFYIFQNRASHFNWSVSRSGSKYGYLCRANLNNSKYKIFFRGETSIIFI